MIVSRPIAFMSATVAIVADCFGVTPSDVLGPSHQRKVVVPRQIAMGILFESARPGDERRSLPVIGRRFGGRDHTTVLHSVRRYRCWCKAAGLPTATDDPAAQTVALMRHLGIERLEPGGSATRPATPSTTPEPAKHDHEETLRVTSRTKRPAGGCMPIPSDPDFGSFTLTQNEFDALPPAMRGEAARLASEWYGSAEAAGAALGLSPACIWSSANARPRPFVLPDAAWKSAEEGGADFAPDAGLPGLMEERADRAAACQDGGFAAFAAAHLVKGAGSILVADAYATYRAFRRARHLRPMPRASFGAKLAFLARARGGARKGDRIEGAGLVLVGGVAAPPCESLRDPPRPVPVQPNRRPPIVLGWQKKAPSGRRIVIVEDDGSSRSLRVPA